MAQAGTAGLAYYGNTLYGSSLSGGNQVVLTVPLGGASPSATGYNLSSLSVFCGWTDHASFSDQNYDLSVSTDGTNYLYLHTVHYMPFLAANDEGSGQSSSSLVTLTNLNASGLATGVKYVRFSLSAGLDANNQAQEGLAIQEIEVFGMSTSSNILDTVVENDQSNIGDNNMDVDDSQFYFTSSQTTNTSEALLANLLSGSTATSSTGGADVGTVSAINDLIATSGTGAIAYYGNTLFGDSLNPTTPLTHGVVELTIPLGGANPASNGYSLSNIKVFEGWTDHASFNDQHYTVSVSTDGVNFTYLHAVNFMPFTAANDVSPAGDQLASTLVSLSHLNVSGVKAIRFALSAGLDANGALQEGQLIQEIEVFGSIPAPVVISRPVVTGNGLIMSGSNGTAGSTYYVLSSTNVAAPLSTWTRVSTNTFDANGNFSVTNRINSNVHRLFYTLQLP
jgi:hypothetical protein